MPTTGDALPIAKLAISEISMIATWIETVIYGINCTMYGASMFVLFRGRKLPAARWVLLLMSTILFLLCTAHIGASLRQLLEAFVYAPVDVPNYSTTYWLKLGLPLPIVKVTIFSTLVSTQDLILIWRLYVVFMYDWRVVILPLILEVAYMATTYAASLLPGIPKVNTHVIGGGLIIAALIFSIILNVSVTMAIATRLWWMGHEVVSLTATRTNRYVSLIYIIVESGAIFSATSVVLLVLFVTKHTLMIDPLAGTSVATQVAALASFLIVVRTGQIGPRYPCADDTLKTVIIPQDENMHRIYVRGELDLEQQFSTSSYPTICNSSAGTTDMEP